MSLRIGVLCWILLSGFGRAHGDDLSLDRWRHLSPETTHSLLALARRAFDAYATRREVIEAPASPPAPLDQRVGVFVSAMRHGAPRCCMGTLYPLESDAAHEIIANAVAASGRDRRFPPIKPAELKSLILIVSIVGKPHPITADQLATLDPLRDGLVVKAGGRYGVVLSGETTQVERMLRWGRIRAGARPDAPVELFQIDVVRYKEPNPPTPFPASRYRSLKEGGESNALSPPSFSERCERQGRGSGG